MARSREPDAADLLSRGINDNRRKILATSLATLATIAGVVASLTIWSLYRAAFEQAELALTETVDSQVHFIDAVARFDRRHLAGTHEGGTLEATISQIADAHGHDNGIGETGEFTLARRDGEDMVFVLGRRHGASVESDRVPLTRTDRAEPMRRALRGLRGTMVGLDYRGEHVLASYAPIHELDLGMVAKMDLAEIRAPFKRAALIALLSGAAIVLVGGWLMVRVTNPLIRAVEDRERQFRTLVENIPGATYRARADVERAPVFISDAIEEISGYPASEFGARTLDSLVHLEDRAAVAADVRNAIAQRSSFTMEHRIVHADGGARWVGESARVAVDDSGAPRWIEGTIFDITRRKAAEDALVVAREVAEAANHAKSEFLSHMSHELRTPLNGVLGYAQILQRESAATPKQRENLNAIESCGRHLLELINAVLDLSKMEAGHLDVEPVPCDLHGLLVAALDIVRPRGEAKGLTMSLEIGSDLPAGVITDGTKLRQALVNLLGNAVKFTAEGSVVLVVSKTGDGRLELSVRDTGIGMAPDEQKQIFDPFKQARGGKDGGGTGLGLAIARRIVEALGGTLEVESGVGTGSSFTIRMPLVEADEAELNTLAGEPQGYAGDAVLEAGLESTILIADDRPANRDILVQLLKGTGFETVQANNGAEALARMRERRFSLVLMDVRMPVRDGMEALRAIRADPALKDTIVVAVSASVFPDFKQRMTDAGFDDFMGKPFQTADLFRILDRHLDARFVATEREPAGVPVAPVGETLAPELAAEVARRLHAAIRLGSVTALKELGSELVARTGAGDYGTRIEALACAFEFDRLEQMANDLERGLE